MTRQIVLGTVALTAALTLAPSLADPGGKERTLDEQGRVIRVVDEFGNATHYRRNAQGALTSILHVRNKAGTWEERFFHDQEGRRIGESIDSQSSEGRSFTRHLKELGIRPNGSLRTTHRTWSDASAILSNDFARVEEWSAPVGDAELAPPGTVVRRQVTTVAGHSVTVEAIAQEDGLRIEDSLGGWQVRKWTERGLMSIADAHGTVVRVERDDLGRPSSIQLGELVAVRYHYADDTPQWTEKRVVDLRDGSLVWSWATAIRPGGVGADSQEMTTRPRAAARAFLPGYGLVAEWDASLYPEGVAVAGLGSLPVVLVSLDDGRAVARSVQLLDPSTARGWDRVDFTADRIFFHLTTDANDADSAEQTAIVSLPRRSSLTAAPAASTVPPQESGLVIDKPGLSALHSPAISISLCGSPNVGCVCIDYDDGVGISCPDGGDGGAGSGGGGGGGGGGEPSGGGGGGGMPAGNPLDPEQTLKLNQAKTLALQKLASLQECRNLFQSLNRTNGSEVINSTTYRDYSTHSKCGGGAPAWTVPNWLRVYLCSAFVGTASNERAATVIHEALHSAGKLESPPYEGEMTSAQIQQLVKDKCDL